MPAAAPPPAPPAAPESSLTLVKITLVKKYYEVLPNAIKVRETPSIDGTKSIATGSFDA